MKTARIFFMTMLLTLSLQASDGCRKDKTATEIATQYNIDLRTKSTKGWIRTFRNDTKSAKYNMTAVDREYMIQCLLEYYKNLPNVGRMT